MKKLIVSKLNKSAIGIRLLILYENYKNHGYPYRRYMNKTGVLFIHIPKCAGTSVLKMLGDSAKYRTHVPAYIYKEANKYKYKKYVKFTIVRNPWDRLYSTYTYLKSGGNQGDDIEVFAEIRDMTFEHFVMNWLTEDKVTSVKLLQTQCSYIRDPITSKFSVDIIGKIEEIDKSIDELNYACSSQWSLPHLNKSKDQGYRDKYSEEMKERTLSLYEADCEVLGYAF